jgi:hypothetical protein
MIARKGEEHRLVRAISKLKQANKKAAEFGGPIDLYTKRIENLERQLNGLRKVERRYNVSK